VGIAEPAEPLLSAAGIADASPAANPNVRNITIGAYLDRMISPPWKELGILNKYEIGEQKVAGRAS
jgi:hypothetical protein